MYLIETGFNLVSLDQPLEFFIYLNKILRVVTYIYVVKVPLYWTQRLRLPLDRILNKIKTKNYIDGLRMEKCWISYVHRE